MVSPFPCVVLVVVQALGVVDHPILCHCDCFVFRVHQQVPQGVDRFGAVYVVGLKNPRQLFRQLTNVGQTCCFLLGYLVLTFS